MYYSKTYLEIITVMILGAVSCIAGCLLSILWIACISVVFAWIWNHKALPLFHLQPIGIVQSFFLLCGFGIIGSAWNGFKISFSGKNET